MRLTLNEHGEYTDEPLPQGVYMSKRPTPPVDTAQYAHPGHIQATSYFGRIDQGVEKAIKLEVHHCTAYLSRKESLILVLQLLNAGKDIYGMNFVEEIQGYVEQYTGN